MSWHVTFSKISERDLRILDRAMRRGVIDRIEWLAEHFESIAPIPLHRQWKGFFKLRVGDWRVVYDFDPSRRHIKICLIDHRNKVYKRHP